MANISRGWLPADQPTLHALVDYVPETDLSHTTNLDFELTYSGLTATWPPSSSQAVPRTSLSSTRSRKRRNPIAAWIRSKKIFGAGLPCTPFPLDHQSQKAYEGGLYYNMDVLGNALTLYDLGIRIASFINGLRHAQDDFLSLRAEADCLRICVNSLGSESCQDVLYHYISVKQREDLTLIIANTVLNMKELNGFLGSCKYLVEKEARRAAKRQRKRDRWRDFLREAWATYKFAMTDPQPFRDKLALPTASINSFLTSVTHVGLANVGNLLSLSGHMPMAGGVGGSAPPRLGTWEVIGRKVAFRKANAIAGADLTVDLEEEIIRYVLHLLEGGAPFHAKEPEAKAKVGRSKSITKTAGSGTYVMRRKTAYVPGSSRRAEFVETEARSQRDRLPPHLAVQASPSTPPSPRLLHIELPPPSPSSPRIIHAEPHFNLPDVGHQQRERVQRSPRRQSAPTQEAREAYTASSRVRSHQYSTARPDHLKSSRQYCRDQVEQEIKQEQEDAATDLRNKSAYMNSDRRTRLFHTMEVKMEEDNDDESDVEDVMELLDEEYGLKVERLYTERETIDNGTVAPIVPTSLLEPGEAEEEEDQPIPPQYSRGSRLKSEVSYYEGPRRTASSRHYSRYQPYDVPRREAYLRRQTRESRYPPDHSDHDLRFDLDGSQPSEQGPSYQKKSSYPNIIIEHHDDADSAKKKRAKEPKPRLQTNELRRTVSDSGTKHTPYIIRKRNQGAPDEDIYMHGARSRASSHDSDNEDISGEDPDGRSTRMRR